MSKLTDFTEDQLNAMSAEETFLRWVILHSEEFSSAYLEAVRLPIHEAIQALAKLEKEVQEFDKKITQSDAGADSESAGQVLFSFRSVYPFMGCHRIGRYAKLLQIVEAIRHYASQNENRLPDALSDVELRLPVDPFTNKPAEYELKEGIAKLRWPLVPNVEEKRTHGRTYKIRMADSE